jgi:cyclic di-GMP phosphodiesterase
MAGEKILIVDDEEPMREIIASMLRHQGYTVQQAASGQDALALLGSFEFELLLADLMMSGVDGIALLERCKEKYPDTLVIMVTAVHDTGVAVATIRNGAYDLLLKPFEAGQLLAVVHRALEHRRLKLENRAYQENLGALVAARTQQLRQSMTDLERSYDITLEALGRAMGLKNAEPSLHFKRVTAFTIALARAMGLSGSDIRVMSRGAFLHDVGLMAIPDAILCKPGSLTEAETEIMREHCVRGYQMLHSMPFLADPAEIVYAHEEHYDGNGFPRGLKGAEIPLGARIVSLVHYFDELTSGDWETALPSSQACRKIEQLSGQRFDPEVVRVFTSMPEKIWNDLRTELAQGEKASGAKATAL